MPSSMFVANPSFNNNNMLVHDQCSSNLHTTSQNPSTQHKLIHHPPVQNSNPHLNPLLSNQAGSSINNITMNHQPLLNYPCFTSIQQHLLPIASNISQSNHQTATSNQLYPIGNNTTRSQSYPSQSQNVNATMESNNENGYKLVQRKKEKTRIKPKTDSVPVHTPSSCSSTSTPISTSTNADTSSTNTDSIITPAHPPNTNSFNNTGNMMVTDTGCVPAEVSHQARRFAETRYAFPPFIIRSTHDMVEKDVINEILNHFDSKYNFNLCLAGHRLKEKRELLLFVNDRESFSMLFDGLKWPTTINSLNFEKILPSYLPPQFSLILRNVPMDVDTDAFLSDIKNDYPEVLCAHRIINKNKQPTSFIRVDINNVKTIEELLRKRFMYINNSRVAVTEYLVPAKVLICTKCFQIGHFRSTCKSILEMCRVCGVGVKDIKKHKEKCTNIQCCVRCKGAHDSNDVRCPDVKSFRAILTKSLLTSLRTNNSQQQRQTSNHPHHYVDQNFPSLNVNHMNQPIGNYASDSTGKRIDELFNKLNKLDENLNRLINLNNNYSDRIIHIQQVVMKHDKDLQIQNIDTSFQKEFINQFISPICQVMIEVIPTLVKHNHLNDKTLLCSSLSTLCAKLANDLPIWTNNFLLNENTKSKITNDYNAQNQQIIDDSTNNKVHPPLNQ
jgi:hypothetical protein